MCAGTIQRIPSSTKEKTVSTEQYETTQRYPHLATRPFITRPTLIAGRCATSHDTERFRVFVWHVFAATDIERTFCQYARGCALLGCDIDTFSPLLTSSSGEEPDPTGSRPRDLIGLYKIGKRRAPNRRKGAAGKRGGQQGLHCGEANPNQRLGGTSGQRPSAGSQC